MNEILAIDIETSSNDRASYWNAKVEIKAPSNYKDESKIKAYIDEERTKLGQKDALRWWTGRVISYAVVNIIDPTDIRYCFDINEKKVLKQLSTDIDLACELWGKSSANFDFPFLIGRYLANDMPIPHALKGGKDIDTIFGYSTSSSQRASLDAYLFGMGLELKSMKGSEIPQMFLNYIANKTLKNNDECALFEKELKEYNISDTMGVVEMVRRYKGIKYEI